MAVTDYVVVLSSTWNKSLWVSCEYHLMFICAIFNLRLNSKLLMWSVRWVTWCFHFHIFHHKPFLKMAKTTSSEIEEVCCFHQLYYYYCKTLEKYLRETNDNKSWLAHKAAALSFDVWVGLCTSLPACMGSLSRGTCMITPATKTQDIFTSITSVCITSGRHLSLTIQWNSWKCKIKSLEGALKYTSD